MYNQTNKNEARKQVLSDSIKALTSDRHNSTIARKTYVKDVKERLINKNRCNDASEASKLSDEQINKWEIFYSSIVQNKMPSDLKVAYLSGPNPENDLKELVELGILPENTWAFESDKKTFDDAIINSISADFPNLKIHKGSISNFFENSPVRFDIVYLDFCNPIISVSKENTAITTIMSALTNHVINSPGILITNFALPSEEQDEATFDLIGKIVSLYLERKSWIEEPDRKYMVENESSCNFELLLGDVYKDLNFYYGQFISRLMMDITSIIIPFKRIFCNENYRNIFFKAGSDILKQKMTFDFLAESTEYEGSPLMLFIDNMHEKIYEKYFDYYDLCLDKNFNKISNRLLSQLAYGIDNSQLIDILRKMHFLLLANGNEHYSDTMKSLIENGEGLYQFCDVFLKESLLGVLIGQLAIPYHINVEKTKRWNYKAKETEMFMDMFVLDECRYVYDFMPTIDMFLNGLGYSDMQLCYRFALDALSKNRHYFIDELFMGTAILPVNEKGFEAKSFPKRITIALKND